MTDIDIDTARMMRMSEAKAYARKTEGYTYHDEKRYEVLSDAAKNEGPASGFMNVGMGLGMGSAVGAQIKDTASAIMNGAPTSANQQAVCPSCNSPIDPNAKFCSTCGAKRPERNRFCSECGAEVAPGAKFCSTCGAKII